MWGLGLKSRLLDLPWEKTRLNVLASTRAKLPSVSSAKSNFKLIWCHRWFLGKGPSIKKYCTSNNAQPLNRSYHLQIWRFHFTFPFHPKMVRILKQPSKVIVLKVIYKWFSVISSLPIWRGVGGAGNRLNSLEKVRSDHGYFFVVIRHAPLFAWRFYHFYSLCLTSQWSFLTSALNQISQSSTMFKLQLTVPRAEIKRTRVIMCH